MEGRDLAKSFGVPFFESSAKSRINVEEAFYELVRVFFVHFFWQRFAFATCHRVSWAIIDHAIFFRSEKSAVKPSQKPVPLPLLPRKKKRRKAVAASFKL